MGVLDTLRKRKTTPKKEKDVVASKKIKSSADSKVTKDPSVKVKKKQDVSKMALDIILGPIVTEKSAHLSKHNVIVFKVRKHANRIAIRNAIRELYRVTPLRVNIVSVRGKHVRFGRFAGKQSDYKKALVHLPKGTSIDLFEGV